MPEQFEMNEFKEMWYELKEYMENQVIFYQPKYIRELIDMVDTETKCRQILDKMKEIEHSYIIYEEE